MSISDPNSAALVAALTPALSAFYSAESILQMAQQLARGEQPEVGDQTMSLHMGSHNTITNATIHMGNRTIHVHLPNPEAIGQSTAHALLSIKLKALLEHHESSTIFRNRLVGFVGREQELGEIRQRIVEVQASGGYVTITGQAGEGKSSIIAQLVAQAGPALCPFHFIPLVPGREYQLSLLTHLTARLIITYNLPIEYFPDHSYPLMRNLFQSVLRQLAVRGVEETIYIDGLDQLERDYQNHRDLSFLPEDPPAGIVFVLGTRPDDTLEPLEILKLQHQYRLPPLSFADFESLLALKRPVATALARQLYDAVKGNVLYLSLIGNELINTSAESVDELLALINADPNNIFKVTLSRIERHDPDLWDTIIYPFLAVLLVTQEPLHHYTLGAMLNVHHQKVRRALNKLGGLVAQDSAGRFFLYHLTIRDYLQGDVSQLTSKHTFVRHEIIAWHRRMAHWCLNDFDTIWKDTVDLEQTRRIYARHHTITHLCLGREYTTLWKLIDDGSYGRHKRQYDPSTRLYALDLDRARDAAIQAQEILYLWRTSLLRVSLSSITLDFDTVLDGTCGRFGCTYPPTLLGTRVVLQEETVSNSPKYDPVDTLKWTIVHELAHAFDQHFNYAGVMRMRADMRELALCSKVESWGPTWYGPLGNEANIYYMHRGEDFADSVALYVLGSQSKFFQHRQDTADTPDKPVIQPALRDGRPGIPWRMEFMQQLFGN